MGLFSKSEEKKKKEFLAACQKGKKKVVLKYCEDEAALKNVPVLKGLHVACQFGQLEIVNLLTLMSQSDQARPRRSTSQRTLRASGAADSEAVANYKEDDLRDDDLVDLINSESPDGSVALHFAAAYCQLKTATLLLDRGAVLNHKNVHGNTPLHKAAWNGDTKMCELLLDHGAKVNAKNKNKSTPLHRAAGRGYIDCAKLLLRRGADIMIVNEAGDTPIGTARKEKKKKMAKLLLEVQNRLEKSGKPMTTAIDPDAFTTTDDRIVKSQSTGNFLAYGSFEVAPDDDEVDYGDDQGALDVPNEVSPEPSPREASTRSKPVPAVPKRDKRDLASSEPSKPRNKALPMKPGGIPTMVRKSNKAFEQEGGHEGANERAHREMKHIKVDPVKRRFPGSKSLADIAGGDIDDIAASAAARHERLEAKRAAAREEKARAAADAQERAAKAKREREERAAKALKEREAAKAEYQKKTITTTGATARLLAAAAEDSDSDDEGNSSDEDGMPKTAIPPERGGAIPEPVPETEVTELLGSIGLKEYERMFHEEGIETIDDLNLLTEANLKELGLKIGARNKLLATRNARKLAAVGREEVLVRGSDGKKKDPAEAKRLRMEKERREREAQEERERRVAEAAEDKKKKLWRSESKDDKPPARTPPVPVRRDTATKPPTDVATSSSSDEAEGDGLDEGDILTADKKAEEIYARVDEMDKLVATLQAENQRYKELMSEAPHEFMCPITLEIMTDPVVVSDGFSYERKAIEIWLKTHSTSPKTGEEVDDKRIVANHALKVQINDWKEKYAD